MFAYDICASVHLKLGTEWDICLLKADVSFLFLYLMFDTVLTGFVTHTLFHVATSLCSHISSPFTFASYLGVVVFFPVECAVSSLTLSPISLSDLIPLTWLPVGPPTLIPISFTISTFPEEWSALWHAQLCAGQPPPLPLVVYLSLSIQKETLTNTKAKGQCVHRFCVHPIFSMSVCDIIGKHCRAKRQWKLWHGSTGMLSEGDLYLCMYVHIFGV